MEKPTGKDICAMVVQVVALLVMGSLAWKYDGNFIWCVMLAGGMLCGINLRKYVPGLQSQPPKQ